MDNEWFEIAYINWDEAILHGQLRDGSGEREVRKVLSDEEKARVVELNERHESERKLLLREMAATL